ncbi:unnamed protein product [Oppiella nova]|uniref:Fibrinogen C-terminal domain-containing protein n=1 Tax=Oppiella nova TaxID=334625 RepID=A0A7R9QFN8_9ACAR|nr:unnamed protein product [Oppiella nova]CAG2164813.1 unnamed protein product [Oppiella nova]
MPILMDYSSKKISQRIAILENNSQTQISVLNDMSRVLNRLESQRQDIISTIDRSEVRISHRLDDIKGDLGKTITLQEVIREDINKLEQQHILNKMWISEQLRTIGKRNVNLDESDTKPSLNIVSADIEANLQMVQTTLYSLKRSTNQIEEQITDLSNNVSGLMNETNSIANSSKGYVESKSFNKAIRNVMEGMKKLEKPNVFIRTSTPEANGSYVFAKDCKEIQDKQSLKNLSGVYRIKPTGAEEPIFVFCDMDTDGGGWTLIQSRHDGAVDFFRDWYEYKYGFGNIATEFWLGLDHIHRITLLNLLKLLLFRKRFILRKRQPSLRLLIY